MTTTKQNERYIIQKRVANTDQWGTVATSETLQEAMGRAQSVEGGESTGVRIIDSGNEYAEPMVVRGV